MMDTLNTLCLSCFLLPLSLPLIRSQSTLCAWNSIGDRDHLNGEYTLRGTFNGYNYWQKSVSTCASPSYYLKVADNNGLWWVFDDDIDAPFAFNANDSLSGSGSMIYQQDLDTDNSHDTSSGSEWPSNHQYQEWCTLDEASEIEVTQCDGAWNYWNLEDQSQFALSMTVSQGTCPSLHCPRIKVSSTGHDSCDGVFTLDDSYSRSNVYSNHSHSHHNGDDTFFYFNPQTFRWYCSDTLGVDDCDDDEVITHHHVASASDGWIDLEIGDHLPWPLDNGKRAILECMDSDHGMEPMESIDSVPVTDSDDNDHDDGVYGIDEPTFRPTERPINLAATLLNPQAVAMNGGKGIRDEGELESEIEETTTTEVVFSEHEVNGMNHDDDDTHSSPFNANSDWLSTNHSMIFLLILIILLLIAVLLGVVCVCIIQRKRLRKRRVTDSDLKSVDITIPGTTSTSTSASADMVELERLSPKGLNPLNADIDSEPIDIYIEKTNMNEFKSNKFLNVGTATNCNSYCRNIDFHLNSNLNRNYDQSSHSVPTMSIDSYTPGAGTAADILSMSNRTRGHILKDSSSGDGIDGLESLDDHHSNDSNDSMDHEESEQSLESNTLTLDTQHTFGDGTRLRRYPREGSMDRDLYQHEGSDDSSSSPTEFEIAGDEHEMVTIR